MIEQNPDQANLLRVVRDHPEVLIERLRPTRWAENTFKYAKWLLEEGAYDDDVDRAALAYTVRRQSFGGIGQSFSFMVDRDLQRSWGRGVERLWAVSERLRGVEILEGGALGLLPKLDGPDTLFYLDPPYVRSVRAPNQLYGEYEMSDHDHRSLCLLVRRLVGKVVLSGYANPIYEELLGGWGKAVRKAFAYPRPGGGRSVKTEVLWKNF